MTFEEVRSSPQKMAIEPTKRGTANRRVCNTNHRCHCRINGKSTQAIFSPRNVGSTCSHPVKCFFRESPTPTKAWVACPKCGLSQHMGARKQSWFPLGQFKRRFPQQKTRGLPLPLALNRHVRGFRMDSEQLDKAWARCPLTFDSGHNPFFGQ